MIQECVALKVLKWLNDNLEKYCCVVLMSVMTLIIFIQVVARYVFQNSLSWSEELARYLFIWLVYLGISYGCLMRKHIKIDAALGLFPKKARKYVVIIGDLFFLAFAVYVAYTGLFYSLNQTRVSSAMGVPFKYVYISIFFGFGLAVIRQIQTIIYRVRCIKNGEEYEG